MGSLRVLVCEDEGLTALRLRVSLERLGYSVVGSAKDGREAVAAASRLRPDAILMDIRMPGMDGISAAERIMRECPTAIVMVTAHSDEEMVARALGAGASGYLVKPVGDEQLRPAISMAWARFRETVTHRNAVREAGEREREVAERARCLVADAERLAGDLRRQLSRERDAARALAESFLCPTPGVPGLDIACRYEPAAAVALVGGDYYDFIELSGGRLGVVIGDVCGKGIAAAGHTAMARYMLRAYAAEDPAPTRAFRRLNRALWEKLSEECAFVTLFYAVLDLETFRLTYANAGHPAPVLRGARLEFLEATGCVMGVLPEGEYEERSVSLEPGAALALFTDGVSEARRGKDMLGVDGVAGMVAELRGHGAAGLAAALLDRAREWAGGELRDDAAVVVLRRE